MADEYEYGCRITPLGKDLVEVRLPQAIQREIKLMRGDMSPLDTITLNIREIMDDLDDASFAELENGESIYAIMPDWVVDYLMTENGMDSMLEEM